MRRTVLSVLRHKMLSTVLCFLFCFLPFYGMWYADSSFGFMDAVCYAIVLMMPFGVFPKGRRLYLIFYLLFFYGPALFMVGHRLIFHTPLNAASIFAVLGTNPREAISFLSAFMTIPLAGILCAIVFLSAYLWEQFKYPPKSTPFIGIAAGFLCGCILLFRLNAPLPMMPFIQNYQTYQAIKRDMIATQQPTHAYRSILGVDETPQTYVIVIGESVWRGAMSLYGYDRETTPFLDKEPDLFVFRNVVSPHAVTMNVLQKALTLADENDVTPAWTKGSLIQFMKDAGFKTFWISNQEEFGLFANLVTVLAQTANDVSFGDGRSYDETLLPKYEKALMDPAPKKVIFVHLNGSHYEYKDRYPTGVDYFNSSALTGKAALRAQYDNSVRYTDGVLKQMLDALKQHPQSAAFLYFSDHGEDVAGPDSCFCHEEAQKTKEMYEVPFVLWMSEAYQQRRPDKVAEIKTQLNEPLNTQYVMETVIDLAGLSHPDVDTSRSLFARKQTSSPKPMVRATADSLGGGGSRWLHMVNSSDRLTAYWDMWPGFEIDVFWNDAEKTFRVSHDTMVADETLADLWQSRPDIHQKYFWLDFKNMTPTQAPAAVAELNRLTALFGLPKSHVLVEGKDGITLTQMTQNGYWTSLYLSCYRWRNPIDRKVNIQRDYAVLAASHIHFVSADADYFQDVMVAFPDYPKLFWNMSAQPERLNDVMMKHANEIAVILNQDKRYFYKPGKVFWN